MSWKVYRLEDGYIIKISLFEVEGWDVMYLTGKTGTNLKIICIHYHENSGGSHSWSELLDWCIVYWDDKDYLSAPKICITVICLLQQSKGFKYFRVPNFIKMDLLVWFLGLQHINPHIYHIYVFIISYYLWVLKNLVTLHWIMFYLNFWNKFIFHAMNWCWAS